MAARLWWREEEDDGTTVDEGAPATALVVVVVTVVTEVTTGMEANGVVTQVVVTVAVTKLADNSTTVTVADDTDTDSGEMIVTSMVPGGRSNGSTGVDVGEGGVPVAANGKVHRAGTREDSRNPEPETETAETEEAGTESKGTVSRPKMARVMAKMTTRVTEIFILPALRDVVSCC
jgi:hypothetical protein